LYAHTSAQANASHCLLKIPPMAGEKRNLECSPLGTVERVFLECKNLSEGSRIVGLSRFFEIQIFLYGHYLNSEENRTSKLVHSGFGF
jgi:hypothetical protein